MTTSPHRKLPPRTVEHESGATVQELLTQVAWEMSRRGATEEQLRAARFRDSRQRSRFDRWTTMAPGDLPETAIALLKLYCTLKWLALDPPSSRNRHDAGVYVAAFAAQPHITLGLRTKENQRKRARNPRGKVDDSGATMRSIVVALRRRPEYRELSAKELWPHFCSELAELGLDPKTIEHASDPRKDFCEYQAATGRKRISFGRVAVLARRLPSSASDI